MADADDWPGFQGDARHTGAAEGELPENLTVLWTAKVPPGVVASPVVAGGKVFIGSATGELSALDLATGNALWGPLQLPHPISGTPAYENGILYVATSTADGKDGDVHLVNAHSGQVVGALGIRKGSAAGPTINAGTLFVGDEAGRMHAYETAGLSKLWMYEASLATGQPSDPDDQYPDDCCMKGPVNAKQVRTSPVVHENRVFFGVFNQMLFAVDASSTPGTEKTTLSWAENLQGIIYSSAGIHAERDRLYVGSYDGRLYSLSTDPVEHESSCIGDARRTAHPYPNPCSRYIYWTYDTDSRIYSSPAVGKDRIYFGDNDGTFHAVSHSGRAAWTVKTGGGIYASPVVVGDKMVVGSYDRHLYVFDEDDRGRYEGVAFHHMLPDHIHASPAVVDGRIIAVSVDGTVVAIGDPADAPPASPPPTEAPEPDDAPDLPDLSVSSITSDPEFPVVGQPFTVQIEVENTGSDAGTVSVTFYMDDVKVETKSVAVGPSATASVTFTHTATAEGQLRLRAAVNEDGAIEEASMANNERMKQSFASAEPLDLETNRDGEAEESAGIVWLPIVLGAGLLVGLVRRR